MPLLTRPVTARMFTLLTCCPVTVLSAQPAARALRAEVFAGVLRLGRADAAAENRWGGVAGVQAGRPLAQRVRATGSLAYLRVNRGLRIAGNEGGFIYDMEAITAMVGGSYDLIATPRTQFVAGAEVGPAWSRNMESGRFGTPRSGVGLADNGYSLSAGGVFTLGIRRTLTARSGVALTARNYIGLGSNSPRVSPSLGLGLILR